MNGEEKLSPIGVSDLAQGLTLQSPCFFCRRKVFDLTTTPFGINKVPKDIPSFIQSAVQFWHTLSPEFQKNIFYFQRQGEWCANIAGHIISMQHETADKTDMDHGIYVGDKSTYFSFSAATQRASEKHACIPDDDLWTKMQGAVGGWENLRKILAIEYDGYYSTWSVRRGDERGIFFRPDVIFSGPGGRCIVLHSGSVAIPYVLDGGQKIPQENIPQHSYVFLTECRPGAQPIYAQESGIYTDSRSPNVYWHCLRLAYR